MLTYKSRLFCNYLYDSQIMDIAYRIKALRKRSGQSQEILAKKSGLSRDAIAGLEQGRHKNPRLNTLFDIVKACGAKMCDLFPGKSEMEYIDSEVGIDEKSELY